MKTVVQKVKSHLEWCFKQEDPLYHVSALMTALDQNVVEKGESYLEQEKQQMIDFAKKALKNASENADIEEYDVTRKETHIDKWGKFAYAGDESEVIVRVNKQSILNESNIPEL